MQPERWRQIEEIFQLAADRPPHERLAFLEQACGGDRELRREVESLLALEPHEGFTAAPAFDDAIRILERHQRDSVEGRRIGAYRILREIGQGGMGTVYLAARADDAFEKLAALKIIRRGLDLDEIVQRFRAERQILAMLDHPNIARLLDGGATDEGLPYFVMEYIEGEPIDQYCDRRKLAAAARLQLFQGVCSAVSYAHQNLIVHRDLKPANVLVTNQGIPRLLDFGIAKVLAPGHASQEKTQTGLHPLTPEYASPEQIRGDPITTASDIYSLGALLYRLLTGHRPYRSPMSSPAEIERAICEEEPERPSVIVTKESGGATAETISQARGATPEKLRARLKGDLDTIVLTALRKDPRRRYASVEQLAEDIRRHLANLPVAARPDTSRYRAAKFIRRNKPWVAMGALTFASLTAGIAVSLWQTHAARQERDRARLEQAKSARINAFLQEIVSSAGVTGASPNRMNHEATVADMLDQAARRAETELADQPQVKAELLGTIGGAYEAQAKYGLAGRYLREAYALDRKLYGPEALETAGGMYALGVLACLSGDCPAAASWFEKALPIFRRHATDPGFDIHLMPAVLSDAAFVKRAQGKFDEAEALWREALTYGPRLPARYRGQSIAPKTFLAQLYLDRGDAARADPLASDAVRDLRAFGGDHFSLAQALIDLGNIRRLQRRYAEADQSLNEGIGLFTQVLGPNHPNVAYGLVGLATSRYYQAQYALAEQDARKALAIVEKVHGASRPRDLANAILARIWTRTGRARKAEPLLREVLAHAQQNPGRRGDIAFAMAWLAECLTAQRRYAGAEPLLTQSYATLQQVQVAQSPAMEEVRAQLSSLAAALGRPASIPN